MVQFPIDCAESRKGLADMAGTSKKTTSKDTAAKKTPSGKGLQGFFKSRFFKFILVCVIAFFGYKAYAHWVHVESYDSAKQLQRELSVAVDAYTDSNGYVDASNVVAFQNAAYKCVQNYEGKHVKSSGKTESGVWVEFDDGMMMIIEPPIEGLLNASLSASTSIKYYEPHEFSDAVQPFVETIRGNPEVLASKFSNARIDSKTLNNVTLSSVRYMGVSNTQQIVVWFGHGGYSPKDGSYLVLGELVDESRMVHDEDYHSMFTSRELIMRPVFKDLGYAISYVAITSKYVKNHIENLDGALVFLVSCNSGRDNQLAQAFLDAGADSVVVFNNEVLVTWASMYSRAFIQALCTPDATGKYPNASIASATARSQVGASLVVNGKGGGEPVVYNNKGRCFALEAPTVNRTSPSTSTNNNGGASNSSGGNSSGATSANSGSTSANGGSSSSANSNRNNSSNTSSGGTSNNGTKSNTENGGSASANTNNTGNGSSNANNGQTAPMPSTTITESDLIGYWSPDINVREPIIVQFYKDNGQLCYHYYRVLLGDGSGHNIGFEHTTFEYYSGRVVLYANQGTCQCLIDGTNNKVGIAFYLDSIKKGYITNQETGELFYRVQQ